MTNASRGKIRRRDRPRRKPTEAAPAASIVDLYKARLGWEPGTSEPFHTTANRGCGGCGAIGPGSEFDRPVMPGRPDLNTCRGCTP